MRFANATIAHTSCIHTYICIYIHTLSYISILTTLSAYILCCVLFGLSVLCNYLLMFVIASIKATSLLLLLHLLKLFFSLLLSLLSAGCFIISRLLILAIPSNLLFINFVYFCDISSCHYSILFVCLLRLCVCLFVLVYCTQLSRLWLLQPLCCSLSNSLLLLMMSCGCLIAYGFIIAEVVAIFVLYKVNVLCYIANVENMFLKKVYFK